MTIFTFDWREHKAKYEQQGWVHVPNGVHRDFVEAVREFVARSRATDPLTGAAIKGAKDQFVYEFGDEVSYDRDLFDVIAPLCGLDRSRMTLSERHIKAYQADADPNPPAHKDRFPSQVSVGLSIDVPAGSHLVMYPYEHREVNPFLSARLRDSLEPDQLPEVVLRDAREVTIYDEPGDVVAFPGSSMWHLRRKSANTVNLYLKFNDFDSDPLGEDPTTSARRAETLALLSGGSDDRLRASVPTLARRFDFVAHEYARAGWQEWLVANTWGQQPFPISDEEFAVLRVIDGRRNFDEVARAGDHGLAPEPASAALCRLALRGALDLVSPASR